MISLLKKREIISIEEEMAYRYLTRSTHLRQKLIKYKLLEKAKMEYVWLALQIISRPALHREITRNALVVSLIQCPETQLTVLSCQGPHS